jgi:ribonucleoside-diphosphate reductase alpha chain
MYAWNQGIKTTYYLRSRARTTIQKATVSAAVAGAMTPEESEVAKEAVIVCSLENPETCEACQ